MTVSGIGSERRRQRGEAARGSSEGQAVGDEDEVGVGWGRKGRMNFAKSSIIYEENGEGRHWGLQRLGTAKGVGDKLQGGDDVNVVLI